MITVGMNYHVLPGKQHDFEEKFDAVIGALNAAPGHTSSTLWKDVADDASYLITSEWSDEQAFSDFISQPGVPRRHHLGQRTDPLRPPAAQGLQALRAGAAPIAPRDRLNRNSIYYKILRRFLAS